MTCWPSTSLADGSISTRRVDTLYYPLKRIKDWSCHLVRRPVVRFGLRIGLLVITLLVFLIIAVLSTLAIFYDCEVPIFNQINLRIHLSTYSPFIICFALNQINLRIHLITYSPFIICFAFNQINLRIHLITYSHFIICFAFNQINLKGLPHN